MNALLINCCNEVVEERPLCGRAYLITVLPTRQTPLDHSKPHRMDYVDRVFTIDGKSDDGTYIYRETFWSDRQCDCVDGYYKR